MNKETVQDFLNTYLNEFEVVEITDGEITLKIPSWPKSKLITLYLNHELNEGQGLPSSFSIKEGS